MTFKDVMEGYQKTVETYLQTLFAEDAPQKQLFDAMRYSLLAGGKRIRPILVLEFCRICGGDAEKAMPFAAAIEMVHTYSLIHDDLPCMDNDDYRRGRLTNHKVFGEANAVLAGDALLTAAFGQLARAELPAERIGKAVALLSQRAGECGMVGGQVLDLAGEQLVLTEEEIYNLHRLKTGALISAACQLGVIAAGGTQEQLDAADRYAEALGLRSRPETTCWTFSATPEKWEKRPAWTKTRTRSCGSTAWAPAHGSLKRKRRNRSKRSACLKTPNF